MRGGRGGLCPGRGRGRVRGREHGEKGGQPGLVAGANMPGNKRERYEQIPDVLTEMFDLRMDFGGDFTTAPTRVDLNGSYAKSRFVLRYYHGEKLRGIVLCHHSTADVDAARTELRQALGKQIRDPVGGRRLRSHARFGRSGLRPRRLGPRALLSAP